MALKDDLIAAKALIKSKRRWYQGNYSNGAGRFCSLGALNKVTSGSACGDWRQRDRFDAGRIALERVLPSTYWRKHGVAAFNDSKKRTHNDVLALFDRAIKAAEAAS